MNERLYIHDFGPVRDVDVEIKPLTVFIGDQGVGKSTIAKLYSLFRWIEKALQQGRIRHSNIQQYNRFKNVYCKYHRIHDFFHPGTHILYSGERCDFEYKDGHLAIQEHNAPEMYDIPKIMYVPAERTILSLMDASASNLRAMPESLAAFSEAFEDGKKQFAQGLDMPYDHIRFTYDPLNKISWINGDGFKTRLTEAASGIQASVPLCVVSEYLARKVASEQERDMTLEETKLLNKRVEEIMAAGYSESVKKAMLINLSGYSHYSNLVNIVEEMEISLFPKSQVEVLRMLIGHLNAKRGNKLLLTTHSPYILAALNISIMCAKASECAGNEAEAILHSAWHVNPADAAVYALSQDEDGTYCRSVISTTTGMVSANYLDSASMIMSEEFQQVYQLYINSLKG